MCITRSQLDVTWLWLPSTAPDPVLRPSPLIGLEHAKLLAVFDLPAEQTHWTKACRPELSRYQVRGALYLCTPTVVCLQLGDECVVFLAQAATDSRWNPIRLISSAINLRPPSAQAHGLQLVPCDGCIGPGCKTTTNARHSTQAINIVLAAEAKTFRQPDHGLSR